MYTMERVQKFRVFLVVVMVLTFSVAVVGASMMEKVVLFVILFFIGLLAALLHFILGLIQKDFSEKMHLMERRLSEKE